MSWDTSGFDFERIEAPTVWAEPDADAKSGDGDEWVYSGILYAHEYAETAIDSSADQETESGEGGEWGSIGFHSQDSWHSDYIFETREPIARVLAGDGTAIQLIISGVVESADYYDEDDMAGIEEAIQHHEAIGVPLAFEFPWQERDTDIPEGDWPLEMTSVFAIHLDDLSRIEAFDINVLGEDCTVSAEIDQVSMQDGLVIVSVNWTYDCPTDVQARLKVETDTEPNEETPGKIVATNPSNSENTSSNSFSSSSSSSSSYLRYSHSAGITGASCVPPGEEGHLHLGARASESLLGSFTARISFDPELLRIDDVHADDAIFAERNEELGSSRQYHHRMEPTDVTINNVLGYVDIEAEPDEPYATRRNTRLNDRILVSFDYTAIGASGTVSPVEWTYSTFKDENGDEIVSPSRVSTSDTTVGIDNGVLVDSAGIDIGEQSNSIVYARVGEEFKRWRQLYYYNAEAVDDVDVFPIEGEAEIVDRIEVPGSEFEILVVEGEFPEPVRNRSLHWFEWTAHSEEFLNELVMEWHEAIEPDKETFFPPESSVVRPMDRVEVEALNIGIKPSWYGSDLSLPEDPLPWPFFEEPDGSRDTIEWGCSSPGRISHQSVEIIEEDGLIPEIGVIYWPLIFDVVADIPGINPTGISRDDIRIEVWSETNPAITYQMGDVFRNTEDRRLVVTLTLLIPKANFTEPEVVDEVGGWTIYVQHMDVGGEADQRFFIAASTDNSDLAFLNEHGQVAPDSARYLYSQEAVEDALEEYGLRLEHGLIDEGDMPTGKPDLSSIEITEQEYPVHFDFDMWVGGELVELGGETGLFAGPGLHMAEHTGKVLGEHPGLALARRGGGPFR